MAPLIKKGITLFAIVALAAASAFVGGTLGFLQGYVYGLGDTAVKASTLTTALRTIRNGDVTNGISQLESNLDVLIMEHWAIGRSDPPLLSWFVRVTSDEAIDRKLLAHVARYRTEYPSAAVVPQVNETITSHLKGYQP